MDISLPHYVQLSRSVTRLPFDMEVRSPSNVCPVLYICPYGQKRYRQMPHDCRASTLSHALSMADIDSHFHRCDYPSPVAQQMHPRPVELEMHPSPVALEMPQDFSAAHSEPQSPSISPADPLPNYFGGRIVQSGYREHERGYGGHAGWKAQKEHWCLQVTEPFNPTASVEQRTAQAEALFNRVSQSAITQAYDIIETSTHMHTLPQERVMDFTNVCTATAQDLFGSYTPVLRHSESRRVLYPFPGSESLFLQVDEVESDASVYPCVVCIAPVDIFIGVLGSRRRVTSSSVTLDEHLGNTIHNCWTELSQELVRLNAPPLRTLWFLVVSAGNGGYGVYAGGELAMVPSVLLQLDRSGHGVDGVRLWHEYKGLRVLCCDAHSSHSTVGSTLPISKESLSGREGSHPLS
ncbi:hypothetical protein KIPB_009225 [Kipferlia bialata]|uniref:Uncharacterized protein n=1 Tax=Kipferlia bialata TaxID=797122 RepID=A0A9K3D1Z3_9EUKA|nr:hypothetical protein KIPB_009225 [Kipferlia bialata]|eukprot:g9225.t1